MMVNATRSFNLLGEKLLYVTIELDGVKIVERASSTEKINVVGASDGFSRYDAGSNAYAKYAFIECLYAKDFERLILGPGFYARERKGNR